MFKKKSLGCLAMVVVLVFVCMLFACDNNNAGDPSLQGASPFSEPTCSNNGDNAAEILREKCKVAFDYFEANNREIQFYNIEEFEVCNANIPNHNKNYFDEGQCYKITLYRQSGSNIAWIDYFFGKLNGTDILYMVDWASHTNHYYNLVKINM